MSIEIVYEQEQRETPFISEGQVWYNKKTEAFLIISNSKPDNRCDGVLFLEKNTYPVPCTMFKDIRNDWDYIGNAEEFNFIIEDNR